MLTPTTEHLSRHMLHWDIYKYSHHKNKLQIMKLLSYCNMISKILLRLQNLTISMYIIMDTKMHIRFIN